MQVINIKIAELKPYKNNPRNNAGAVDAVAASIKEFGFKVPIIIDQSYEVVAGHTRLKAAIKLGLAEVPCIIASDLTPEQIKAFRLADNKTAELAEWNIELLELELKEIDMDMSIFGFEDIMTLGEPKEDDYDIELPEEPICELGDIYQLGDHRLICGDSTKAEDVAKLMNGNIADLVVTDPPYNVNYEGATKDKLKMQNDKMTSESFLEFLSQAFSNIADNLKSGGAFYIFHADTEGENFRRATRENLGAIRQCLVWAKNAIVMGRQDYHWKHEPILYGWKEGAAHYFIDDRTQSTVICEDKPSRNEEHPTMKPIKLLAQLIKNSSKQNEIVLDTFGGSGSTLIACEKLNRKCYTVELDPKYCDVIINRYEKLTGKKAVKIGGDT